MPDTNAQRCLACGAPLNAPLQGGKIKCPFCNTVNVVGPQEKRKGDDILCPECGAVNPKDAQHCGRCGIKLEFNCPKCGAVNSYGTAFCVKCGVDIQEELDRLAEEKRRQEEEVRRQQEAARRQQEEAQRQLEENKKKLQRRQRITTLVVAGIVGAVLICVGAFTLLGVYNANLSPSAKQTKTAVMANHLATAAQQSTAAARQTAAAEYRTLFHDDFSNPNSGWDYYENENGSANYGSGGYLLQVFTPNWVVWDTLPDVFPNDVSIEVDAIKQAGPDDNGFGVICRLQDNSNFYYFAISSDGYAVIYRYLQGEFTVISSGDGQWQKVDGVYSGAYTTNHIRADCIGNTLTLYANGVQVATATDNTFTTGGQVSLAATTFDTAGVEILFKNFYVYQP